MAFILNNKKIAGVGAPGKTAYEAAIDGGYAKTEEEFNERLATNIVSWENVANKPTVEDLGAAPASHVSDTNNPHSVTAAQVGAVKKTGDTMTGNLTIQKASFPQMVAFNTGTNRSAYLQAADDNSVVMQNRKDSTNRTSLILYPETGEDSGMLRLYRSNDNGAIGYKVYHEGNKPTPADIGAASSSHNHSADDITSGILSAARGGTGATGCITNAGANAIMKKASDGDNMWYLNTASGALYATAANGAPKFGTLPVAQGGTGVTSLADLATALGGTKIEIGSYTGTGVYGANNPNTLTFSNVPKLVFLMTDSGSAALAGGRTGSGTNNFIAVCSPYSMTTTGTYISKALWNIWNYTTSSGTYYTSGMCSADKKTISWYNHKTAEAQFNDSGVTYTTIALY